MPFLDIVTLSDSNCSDFHINPIPESDLSLTPKPHPSLNVLHDELVPLLEQRRDGEGGDDRRAEAEIDTVTMLENPPQYTRNDC